VRPLERVDRLDSVGRVLAQDLTQVVAGESKRTVLRRGHRITAADLDLLASIGKEHLYVLGGEEQEDLHENDAAALLAGRAAGDGVSPSEPVEGKADLVADRDGLLRVNRAGVDAINRDLAGIAALITAADGSVVRRGQRAAVARIFPFTVPPAGAHRMAAAGPAVRVLPFRPLRAGAVITGAEVKSGRVKDAFRPFLEGRLTALGASLASSALVGDDPDAIAQALRAMADSVDLLFVTGGMAVDPDDVSAEGIARAGGRILFRGVPMLPGSLLTGGILADRPLLGVPAGVLFDAFSALDVVLPWVLAEGMPDPERVLQLGVGGLNAGGHRHGAARDGAAVGPGTAR
jgi:hypothetical protein